MSPASNSDEILDGARRSLKRVRSGPPIGSKSRALRKAHFFGKVARAAIAVGVMAFFGRFSWGQFFSLIGGIAVIGSAVMIVSMVTGA